MNASRRKESLQRRYWGVRPWTRHSLVLLVAGLVYMAIGFTYYQAETSSSRELALSVILEYVEFKTWGIVFMLAGASAAISARYPPVAEKWGYMVLTGLSAGWAAAYAVGILVADSPWFNLTAVLLWSLVSFLWWAISGLLNPPAVFSIAGGKRSWDPPRGNHGRS